MNNQFKPVKIKDLIKALKKLDPEDSLCIHGRYGETDFIPRSQVRVGGGHLWIFDQPPNQNWQQTTVPVFDVEGKK